MCSEVYQKKNYQAIQFLRIQELSFFVYLGYVTISKQGLANK